MADGQNTEQLVIEAIVIDKMTAEFANILTSAQAAGPAIAKALSGGGATPATRAIDDESTAAVEAIKREMAGLPPAMTAILLEEVRKFRGEYGDAIKDLTAQAAAVRAAAAEGRSLGTPAARQTVDVEATVRSLKPLKNELATLPAAVDAGITKPIKVAQTEWEKAVAAMLARTAALREAQALSRTAGTPVSQTLLAQKAFLPAESIPNFGDVSRINLAGKLVDPTKKASLEIEQAIARMSVSVEGAALRMFGAFGPFSRTLQGIPGLAGIGATALEGVARSSGLGATGLLAIGATAAGVATAGVAVFSLASSSAELDRALRPVLLRMDDFDESAVKIKAHVRELAAEVGRSETEIAAGLGAAFETGSRNIDAAFAITRAGATGAALGLGTVDQAVQRIDNVLDAYDISASEAAKTTAKLFLASREGEAAFGPFIDRVTRAGSSADTLGFSLEQVAGVMAAASKQGVDLQRVGTGLETLMLKLARSTDEANKRIRAQGIDLTESGRQASGLIGIISQIREKFGSDKDLLAELFGSPRTAAAIFAIIGERGNEAANVVAKMGDTAAVARKEIELLNQPSEQLARTWAQIRADAGVIGDTALQVTAALLGTKATPPPPELAKSPLAEGFVKTIDTDLKTGHVDEAIQATINAEKLGRDAGDLFAKEFIKAVVAGKIAGLRLTSPVDASAIPADVRKSIDLARSDIEKFAAEVAQGKLAGFTAPPQVLARGRGGVSSIVPVKIDVDSLSKQLQELADLASRNFVETFNEGAKGLSVENAFKQTSSTPSRAKELARIAVPEEVTHLQRQIDDALAQITPSPLKLAIEVDEGQARKAVERIRLPFVPLQFEVPTEPKTVQQARATVAQYKNTPEADIPTPDKTKLDAAVETLRRYGSAQKEVADLETQLRSRSADGTARQIVEQQGLARTLGTKIDALEREKQDVAELRTLLADVLHIEQERIAAAESRAALTAEAETVKLLEQNAQQRAAIARASGDVKGAAREEADAIELGARAAQLQGRAQSAAALEGAKGSATVTAAVEAQNRAREKGVTLAERQAVLTRQVAELERRRAVGAEIAALGSQRLRGLDAELDRIRRNAAEERKGFVERTKLATSDPKFLTRPESKQLIAQSGTNESAARELALLEARRTVLGLILNQARGLTLTGGSQRLVETQLLALESKRTVEQLRQAGATEGQVAAYQQLLDIAKKQSVVARGLANASIDPAARGEAELLDKAIAGVRDRFKEAEQKSQEFARAVEGAALRARTGAQAVTEGTQRGIERLQRYLADDYTRALEAVGRQWQSFEQGGVSAFHRIAAEGANAGEVLKGFFKDQAFGAIEEKLVRPFLINIGKGLFGAPEAKGDPKDPAARLSEAAAELLRAAVALQNFGQLGPIAPGGPSTLTNNESGAPFIGAEFAPPPSVGPPGSAASGAPDTAAATESGQVFKGFALSAGQGLAASVLGAGTGLAGILAGFGQSLLGSFTGGLGNAAAGGFLSFLGLQRGGIVPGRVRELAHGGIVGGTSIPPEARPLRTWFREAAGGGVYDNTTFLKVAEVPGLRELVAPLQPDGSLEARYKGDQLVVRVPSGAEVPVDVPEMQRPTSQPKPGGPGAEEFSKISALASRAPMDLSRGSVDPALRPRELGSPVLDAARAMEPGTPSRGAAGSMARSSELRPETRSRAPSAEVLRSLQPSRARGQAASRSFEADTAQRIASMRARPDEPYARGGRDDGPSRSARSSDTATQSDRRAGGSAPIAPNFTIHMPAITMQVSGGGGNPRAFAEEAAGMIAELAVKAVTAALRDLSRGGTELRHEVRAASR